MSSVPGGLNVFATQKHLFEYLVSEVPWTVVAGEVPDSENVRMVNGVIEPYVVVRFSDILRVGGQGSFGGARLDGYYSLIQTVCIANSMFDSLELASLVNDKMLGYTADENSGMLTKDFGGGSFSIKGDNSRPTFFVSIAAFRFLTNLQTE